jgi:hypothetical protein
MTFRAQLTQRITRSMAWRIEELTEALRREVADLRAQVEQSSRELRDHTGDLDRRLGEVERRLHAVEGESSWSANELARLAPQAAAFEARLEQQFRPIVLTGDLADVPEARLLLEAVREEHARVRARLALVSAYEERLRRLEHRPAPQDAS